MSWKLFLSAFQITSLLITMAVFAKYMPWLNSEPISSLSSPGVLVPEWAESFSDNHGILTFYEDSPALNPNKVWMIIGFIFCNWLFLIYSYISRFGFSPTNEGKE